MKRAGHAHGAAAVEEAQHAMVANAMYACMHGNGRGLGARLHCGVSIYRFSEVCMTRALSVALLVGGIVLLYFGGQSFHSINDHVARFFTGSPATKTILLIAGGAVAMLAGLIWLLMPGGKR